MQSSQLSIKQTMFMMLGAFLVLAILNYFTIQFFQDKQKDDAAVVNAAGRNRMLSQQIAFFSEQVAKGQLAQRNKLEHSIDLHEVSLNALKVGGVAPGIANDNPLPPTPTSILPTLLNAETLWAKYKFHAEVLVNEDILIDTIFYTASLDIDGNIIHIPTKTQEPNPAIQTSLAFIEGHAIEMLQRNNTLVQQYVSANTEKQEALNAGLFFLLITNIGLIAVTIRFLNSKVVKPLQIIEKGTARLAEGFIDTSIDYQAENEIGRAIQNVKKLAQHLEHAARFAQEVGKGEFQADFVIASEQDNLGTSLIAMRNQLADAAQNEHIRSWITEGIAKFAELSRTYQHKSDELAEEAISELIKYLNANQGAFYIVNEESEDPYLELLSLHAWGRKKYIQQKIEKGEGLAGQVWQEEAYMYLTEIPEDYIEITSGLGRANPKSILIVPLKANDKVIGVLEIASFNAYENYQIEFTIQVAEVIASTLSVIRTNDITLQYLAQAQEQAEELRSQEEEIRQNMEEISATQEEMFRKEKEYIRRIGELEHQLSEVQDVIKE